MKHSLVITLLCLSTGAAAQDAPALRVQPGGSFAGALSGGAPCFPVSALEAAGARVQSTPAGATAVLQGDTLELQATSPFLRARGVLHQLAHPVSLVDGELCIPEQFFVQWLPRQYPGKIAYRDGALRVDSPPAVAAKPSRPPARVVVIDPGHGGPDPGRIGPNGLREKDVVLQISQRLADVLRARNFEVHLTRTRDTLIALADRPRLANRWKGERPMALYVSIHANAVARGSAQGFETFFLSDARTEDERRVAEMENAAVEFEEKKEAAHATDLDQVLNGLRNDFYVKASNDLAAVVQDRLDDFHPGPNRGVKRAGFRVLVGAIMPAVLVEVAFISDREEARALGTAEFQQKLANGIADAVGQFFARNEHLWLESANR